MTWDYTLENPQNATNKQLELISVFGKGAEYKINTQKSVAFLYTKNELLERESKKTFTIA